MDTQARFAELPSQRAGGTPIPMVQNAVRAGVVICALLLVSCSYDRSSFQSAKKPSNEQTITPVNIQVVGKVRVDEFNDEPTREGGAVQGGDITVAFPAEPNVLNPWTDNSAYSAYITSYIFSTLLRQDPETFAWEGSLADRWIEEDVVVMANAEQMRGAVLEDKDAAASIRLRTSSGERSLPRDKVQEIRKGVAFTFYLRKDAKFHDGRPVTAADVKFSFETLKNEYVDAPSLRSYYNDLESCEVLDSHTVRLTYKKQYWMARSFAGGFEILPKHIFDPENLQDKNPEAFGKQFNESPFNRKPVGSGPYKFEHWETGVQVVLRRNDQYWDVPRRGHLDRLMFRFITDNVAALQSLKNGSVDFIPETSPEQFDHETISPDFQKRFVKAEYYTGGFRYVGWNMRKPPFDDVRVRQAMAYGALDRQKFLSDILYGHGVVVTGAEYIFGPAYDRSILPQPFDQEKAKALLLEAGWYDRDGDGLRDKNGKPFRFELLQPAGFELYVSRAALMKENLRRLGIDMTVRELEWATFIEHINDRKYDACSLGWGTPIESDPYQTWHTSQSQNRGSNHVGFGTPETDHLIELSRGMLDDQERRKLFFRLHAILHETQPYLFMYTESDLGIYAKRFRGVKWYKVRPGYDLSEWYQQE
jgi:peptide/nickel transport system substrate-binding protein